MKIIGHLIIFDVPEHTGNYHITEEGNISNGSVMIDTKCSLKSNFTVLGTIMEITTLNRIDHVIPNHYIDYMDLSKEFVNPLTSFASWRQFYGVSDHCLIISFAEYLPAYKGLKTMPKTANMDPSYTDFLEQIDLTKSKYILNKFGVPVNFNGYHKYDLNNFKIKPGVYYSLKSDKEDSLYVVCNTSIDINIDIVNPESKRKERLYDNLINKRIKLFM